MPLHLRLRWCDGFAEGPHTRTLARTAMASLSPLIQKSPLTCHTCKLMPNRTPAWVVREWHTASPPYPITSCAPLRSLAFRNIPLPSRCGGRLSRENGSGHAHRPATNRGWPCLWKRPNACLDVRHPKARSLSISQKMRSSLSPLRDQPVDKRGNVRPCQSVPVSVSELLKASW